MKIRFLLLCMVLLGLNAFCQIKYEKGYLIDNENHRIECLIKNMDWENNPSEFEYKINEDSLAVKGNLFNVNEFGIPGSFRFVRVNTKIDRSSTDLTTLSTERNPLWSQEQLFLRVLIEGKASLYLYRESNWNRFFYSVSDMPVQQLIYKGYYAKEKSIAYNNNFRQQLWSDVRNASTKRSSLETIEYSKNELENYFKHYNELERQALIIYDDKNRDFVILRITPGINYSSVTVMYDVFGPVNTYSAENFNFRIGLEADIIFPFKKNKWGLIIDPSYQYIHTEKSDISIDYNSIEFPIGIRYNFFLNDNLKIFLNGFIIPKFVIGFNSTIAVRYLNTNHHMEVSHNNSLAFGGGLHYRNASLEVRYYPNSNLLRTDGSAWTEYHRTSLIVGYTLFNCKHK